MQFPTYMILGAGGLLAAVGWLSYERSHKLGFYTAAVGVPVLLWAVDKADRNARQQIAGTTTGITRNVVPTSTKPPSPAEQQAATYADDPLAQYEDEQYPTYIG